MRERAITGFGVLLLFVLAFSVFFFLNFKTVIVSGPSMMDALQNGDRLLSSRAYWLIGAIRVKDIVVIRNEDGKGYIIKRVYKMGGEKVPMDLMPEGHRFTDGEYVVPDGSIYVLGDNRPVSEDSRKFGAVPVNRVLGKIVVLPPSWVASLAIVGGLLVGLLLVLVAATAVLDARRKRASSSP